MLDCRPADAKLAAFVRGHHTHVAGFAFKAPSGVVPCAVPP
jgi:hypothetical protein